MWLTRRNDAAEAINRWYCLTLINNREDIFTDSGVLDGFLFSFPVIPF